LLRFEQFDCSSSGQLQLKFHDVRFKRLDMGSSQLLDFWQSEYCEKLTCILVTKFKLLYLR
jgi:hypothetical protein